MDYKYVIFHSDHAMHCDLIGRAGAAAEVSVASLLEAAEAGVAVGGYGEDTGI